MASGPLFGVRVVGLRELRAAMREAEAGSQKHLAANFRTVASLVASAAAGRVPVLTGTAAASVRARATATSASIVAGGGSAPYFLWLEYGGSTGPGHVTGQAGSGSVKRPIVKAGRSIYPTIADMSEVIVGAANDAIGDALTEAGWKRD